MSDQGISNDTRDSIIEDLDNGEKTQQEIADSNDVSQSTVSNISRGLSAGKDKGHEEGVEEGKEKGYSEAMSFMKSDTTEKSEEDDYWCAYCKKEGNGQVQVDYMAEECPNGHDLSGDW